MLSKDVVCFCMSALIGVAYIRNSSLQCNPPGYTNATHVALDVG